MQQQKPVCIILAYFNFLSVFFLISCSNKFQWEKKQEISVKEMGAKGDGISDDTDVLKKVFTHCVTNRKIITLDSGIYIVSGPLISESVKGKGKIKIRCIGSVKIIIHKDTKYLDAPFIWITFSNTGYFIMEGGTLLIDLNNKLSYGIRIDALGIKADKEYEGLGGKLKINTQLTIKNVYADSSSSGRSAGLIINGVFKKIELFNTSIINVGRHPNFPAITPWDKVIDESKGIAVLNLKGHAEIINSYINNVFTTNDRDADGIAIFGYRKKYKELGQYYKTEGSGIIKNAVVVDAQGRGIKIQCSNVKIINPFFLREKSVSIVHGNDIDFQFGNGYVINSKHEYRMFYGISPIKSANSFSCIVFQNKLKDKQMYSTLSGSKLISDVPVANYVSIITGKESASWTAKIENISIDNKISKLINRSFVEFSFNKNYGIPSMHPKARVKLLVNNVKTNSILVAYTGYDNSKISQKVYIKVDSNSIFKNNQNKTLIHNLSGLLFENKNSD